MATPDYFDYAAATPLDPRVLEAMQPYFSERFHNPSATYGPARQVSADLQAARAKVAHWLGVRPSEVIFTAGGSEADNLAIHGVMRSPLAHGGNLVVSAIEHDAVLHPAARYDMRQAAATPQGFVDVADLLSKVDDDTVLVGVMYANNEVGTIQPLREIAAGLAKVREARRAQGNARPLYFHTDACQAAQYLDLHVARLGVDMLTLNGGKIYGPKQSGALYVRGGISLQPLIDGGGQENGLRSGTENVAACIGLSTALDLVQSARHDEVRRMQQLQQAFFQGLAQQVPQAVINGSPKKRLPNNIHLTVPGIDNERVLVQLEAAGVLAAAGSACSASSQEASHVLQAMGISEAAAQASLRFSMGRQTDEAAVQRAITALVAVVAATPKSL